MLKPSELYSVVSTVVEHRGHADVKALVAKDGQIVDVGKIVIRVVIDGSPQIVILHLYPNPFGTQLLILAVGVKDETVS